MKHFDKLRELENAHIQMDCLLSVVKMIDPHVQNVDDVSNTLTIVTDHMELTTANMRDRFGELWNDIRDDSWAEDTELVECKENYAAHNRFEHIVNQLMTR
jgi:RES domain-containing protein